MDTNRDNLRDFVLARIREEDEVAHAAGHGYGHQPLGTPRNAGWLDIDVEENCRPSYDIELLKRFTPDRIRFECELKLRLIAQSPTTRHLTITLAMLAESWSSHPQYQESFKMTKVLAAMAAMP